MHVIRLRGPWELDADDGSPPRNVQIPCDPAELLETGFTGRVRLIRPFNTPTNLDPHERVYLVLEGLARVASLTLNGVELAAPSDGGTIRADITAHLGLHNRLEAMFEMPGGKLGEVRLEIG